MEAYDLLRDIYLERGYRRQDIPRLILEKNLYGLDIDDRAAQLAGFALLMKARADDRRLFGQPVALNVLALQEAKAGSAEELHSALNAPQISHATVSQLVNAFEQAKTFGSLIQIPDELASALPDLRRELGAVCDGGDMLGRDAAEILLRLVAQAEVLAKQFDAVVANPPYMGSKYHCTAVKDFCRDNFPVSKPDLYSVSTERYRLFCKESGMAGVMTPFTWMFLTSYKKFRDLLLQDSTILSLIHPEYHAIWSSAAVPICAYIFCKSHVGHLQATYIDLNKFYGEELQPIKALEAIRDASCPWRYSADNDSFTEIPGHPIAFTVDENVKKLFSQCKPLADNGHPCSGLQTGDNDKFLKYWHEVPFQKIEISASGENLIPPKRWLVHRKGGDYRRWYGNLEYVLDWKDQGAEIRQHKSARPQNIQYWFVASASWSHTSSALFSVRYAPEGTTFNVEGPSYISDDPIYATALLCSSPVYYLTQVMNPTLHFLVGTISDLPVPNCSEDLKRSIVANAKDCIKLFKDDWDSLERSWDFDRSEMIKATADDCLLSSTYGKLIGTQQKKIAFGLELERKNDSYFVKAYDLKSPPPVNKELRHLTLSCNPNYNYWIESESIAFDERFRNDEACRLVSYTIGCMMGRYSLDAPGLIYAHAGNEGFDPSRYQTFPADDDGIVPITDEAWFDDDGANRIREFVRVVWSEETEAENMAWLAESLGSKASESADDTIRRYLSKDFYKDHLQTYKKRPIYWLFSSGKHKAFEALVYLHRYNAGTLSRMRMEYVVPLQSRMQARIDNLEQDIQSSTSSAEQKRCQKQKDKLIKQLDELRRFDENLRHYADQRITLDLDDGVKVNYGKFGDLLAEVKAVTGKKAGD